MHRADVPNTPAQPAMRWIAVQAWMPEQRNGEMRNGQGNCKAVHPGAQGSGVPLENASDEI